MNEEFIKHLYDTYASTKGSYDDFRNYMDDPEFQEYFYDKYLKKKGRRDEYYNYLYENGIYDFEIPEDEDLSKKLGEESDETLDDLKNYSIFGPLGIGAYLGNKVGKPVVNWVGNIINKTADATQLRHNRNLGDIKNTINKESEELSKIDMREIMKDKDVVQKIINGEKEETLGFYDSLTKINETKGRVSTLEKHYDVYIKSLEKVLNQRRGQNWKKELNEINKKYKELSEKLNNPDTPRFERNEILKEIQKLAKEYDKYKNDPLLDEYFATLDKAQNIYTNYNKLFTEETEVENKKKERQQITNEQWREQKDNMSFWKYIQKQRPLIRMADYIGNIFPQEVMSAAHIIAPENVDYAIEGVNNTLKAYSDYTMALIPDDIKNSQQREKRVLVTEDNKNMLPGLEPGDKVVLDDKGQVSFVRDKDDFVKQLDGSELENVKNNIKKNADRLSQYLTTDVSTERLVDSNFRSGMDMIASMILGGVFGKGLTAAGMSENAAMNLGFFASTGLTVFDNYYKQALEKGLDIDSALYESLFRTAVNSALETFMSPMELRVLKGGTGGFNKLEKFLAKKTGLAKMLEKEAIKHPTFYSLLNTLYATGTGMLGEYVEEETQNLADAYFDKILGDAKSVDFGDMDNHLNTLWSTIAISVIPGIGGLRTAYRNTNNTIYNLAVHNSLQDLNKTFAEIDNKVKAGKLEKHVGELEKVILVQTKSILDKTDIDENLLQNISGTVKDMVRDLNNAAAIKDPGKQVKVLKEVGKTMAQLNTFIEEYSDKKGKFVYEDGFVKFVPEVKEDKKETKEEEVKKKREGKDAIVDDLFGVVEEEETPKEKTPKEETSKEEIPKEEIPKEETPKEETPKEENPRRRKRRPFNKTKTSEEEVLKAPEEEPVSNEGLENKLQDEIFYKYASIGDRNTMIGHRVSYKGNQGIVEKGKDGLFYIKYDDGDKELMEYGETPLPNMYMGVEYVKPENYNETGKEVKSESLIKEEYKIQKDKEEKNNIEKELSDAAENIGIELKKNKEFESVTNAFTDVFDEEGTGKERGLKGTFASRHNASVLAKALLDSPAQALTKIKKILGEEVVKDLQEKAAKWQELSKDISPYYINKRKADARAEAREINRLNWLEENFPGIRNNIDKLTSFVEAHKDILPWVKMRILSTPFEYRILSRGIDGRAGYDTDSHEIIINPFSADIYSVKHEIVHAVFYRLFSAKHHTNDVLMLKDIILKVLKNGTKKERAVAAEVEKFITLYQKEHLTEKDLEGVTPEEALTYLRADEFLAELGAALSKYGMKISKRGVGKIKEELNKSIRAYSGFEIFKDDVDIDEVIDFVNNIYAGIDRGISIEKFFRGKLKDIFNKNLHLSNKSFKFSLDESGRSQNIGSGLNSIQKKLEQFEKKNKRSARIRVLSINALGKGKYYNPKTNVYEEFKGGIRKVIESGVWSYKLDEQKGVNSVENADFIFGILESPIESPLSEPEALKVFVGEAMKTSNLSEQKLFNDIKKAYQEYPLDMETLKLFDRIKSFDDLLNAENLDRRKFFDILNTGFEPINNPFHSFIHNRLGIDKLKDFNEKIRDNFVNVNYLRFGDVVLVGEPNGFKDGILQLKNVFLPTERVNINNFAVSKGNSPNYRHPNYDFKNDLSQGIRHSLLDKKQNGKLRNIKEDLETLKNVFTNISLTWSSIIGTTPEQFYKKYDLVDLIASIDVNTPEEVVKNLMKDYGVYIFDDLSRNDERFADEWLKVKDWVGVVNDEWTDEDIDKLNQAWENYFNENKPVENFLTKVFDKFRDLLVTFVNAIKGTSLYPKSLKTSFENLINTGTFDYNKKVNGSKITKIVPTYTQEGKGNLWIRQSNAKDNIGRTLLVQYSSEFLNKEAGFDEIAESYYEKLYQKRDGYLKNRDFWEIPVWITNAASLLRYADVYIVRNQEEFLKFLKEAEYTNVAFSVMDVNKKYVKEALHIHKGTSILGGYVKQDYFENVDGDIKWMNEISDLSKLEQKEVDKYTFWRAGKVRGDMLVSSSPVSGSGVYLAKTKEEVIPYSWDGKRKIAEYEFPTNDLIIVNGLIRLDKEEIEVLNNRLGLELSEEDFKAFEEEDINLVDFHSQVVSPRLDSTKNQRKIAKTYKDIFDIDGFYDYKGHLILLNPDYVIKHEKIKVGTAPGTNYRHFKNTETIPRIKLSDGCKHKCAFCDVIHNGSKVTEESKELIDKQVAALSQLNFKLVYVDDKTFGQAKNKVYLGELYKRIQQFNPDFKGFIIQTTATQLSVQNRLTIDELKRYGVKFVEIGLETFNDDLLKAVNKPHRTTSLRKAFDILREGQILTIPNIIVGIEGETEESYNNTLNFLKEYSDNISHLNIYNLALYEGTKMAEDLATTDGITEQDLNENILEKSFHTNPEVHRKFRDDIYNFASKQLDKKFRYQVPNNKGRKTFDWVYGAVRNVKTHKLDDIKKVLKNDFTVLTAENPLNVEYSDKDNAYFNKEASKWLKDKGLKYYEVVGKYDGKGEHSFLVPLMDYKTAYDFMIRFNQDDVANKNYYIKKNEIFKRVGDVNFNKKPINTIDDNLTYIKTDKDNIYHLEMDYDWNNPIKINSFQSIKDEIKKDINNKLERDKTRELAKEFYNLSMFIDKMNEEELMNALAYFPEYKDYLNQLIEIKNSKDVNQEIDDIVEELKKEGLLEEIECKN